MKKTTTLIAKYGKREHLEMLADGLVFLNPISKYRNDSTVFRGDENEGIVPIDPSTMKIFDKDGNNILKKIPLPNTVKQSFVGDDSLLMFCASLITQKILINDSEHYVFSENYKNEMSKFGDYVLLFHTAEFLELFEIARKKSIPEFGYRSGPIIYRNLNDFNRDGDYLKSYRISGSNLAPYFVKSEVYKHQNEW